MTTETAGADRRGARRRRQICEAALDLAAGGGNRAVTHHAIDSRLGIARGSTSYYYRTRQDLLESAIAHLSRTSRDVFQSALATTQWDETDSVMSAAVFISAHVDHLLHDRRRDVLARYALAADAASDVTLRSALAGCLFSLTAARDLMAFLGAADPAGDAHDLLSLLEGLLFDRLYGARSLLHIPAGTPASTADLTPVIYRWLATAACTVDDTTTSGPPPG
ncbi:transcriptional regulator, TetR family [Williamsia sterculiae]|uniref:Transcriptional regulator, TetR family n=2 Tax=Williamsia sterculiae TaxID=1344003 RepID=A0A1N7GS92_9NOCA|nr:transcriptional regulator, TetR family [Williamsia sterculiae]